MTLKPIYSEYFLRKVFGLDRGGMIEQANDPAGAAIADFFDVQAMESPLDFKKAQAALAYGLMVLDVRLDQLGEETGEDQEAGEILLKRCLFAEDEKELHEVGWQAWNLVNKRWPEK